MKKLMLLATLIMGTISYAQTMTTVIGEGEVKIVPDEVTVRVRVENSGKDASTVKTENDKAVDEVLRFTKKMGIKENHVTTQYVRLNKNYDYNTKTYKYQANQSISILITDLDSYDEIMEGLLKSGINNIDGINFSSSKMEEYEAKARTLAVNNAKQKATSYASVLGQSIGKALNIKELGTSVPSPQPMYAARMEADMVSGKQTLAPGEMTISARIQISFALD